MAYTSCGRCHYDNDLYGGLADLFGEDFRTEQITRGELDAHVVGAETIARGKQLVIERGCLGGEYHEGWWEDVGTPQRLQALDVAARSTGQE